MTNLSEQNIDFIVNKVNGSSIESIEMKEDLIDHFCCAIEEEMRKGLSFEKSYDKAYQNICPDGFDEIQRETIFLLTFKNNKVMKRLLYFSGYLTAIGIITTICLKITNTPDGSIAGLVSFAILIFLFLPSLFMNLYKRAMSKTFINKLIYLSGFIALFFLMVYIFFKIQHWAFGLFPLITSIVFVNFALFPLLFFKMYRKS